MRIIYGDNVIAIKLAYCLGKRLILEDLDGVRYYTDDYFDENIAHRVLNDLATNGYIRVKNIIMY